MIIHRNTPPQVSPDGYTGPPLTAEQLADCYAGRAPRVYSAAERARIRKAAQEAEAARLAAIQRTAPLPDAAIRSIGDVLPRMEVKE